MANLIICSNRIYAWKVANWLGARKKEKGYYKGKGYLVTWSGKIDVDLQEVHQYVLSHPIGQEPLKMPRSYSLKPESQEDPKTVEKEQSSLDQLKIIKSLLTESEKVIAAYYSTYDSELLFGYLFEYLNIPKSDYKIAYLHPSSFFNIEEFNSKQTCSTVTEHLYKKSHLENLFLKVANLYVKSQLALLAPKKKFDLELHEYPFLAKVCQRYIEARQTKKQNVYHLEFIYRRGGFPHKFVSSESWNKKHQAEHHLRMCQKLPDFVVESVSSELVTEPPPPLHNLSSIQILAGKKYGFDSSFTLKVLDKFVERDFISNVLTYRKSIPIRYWDSISRVVKALYDYPNYKSYINSLKTGVFNPLHVKEQRADQGYGILTQTVCPFSFTSAQYMIYSLISDRILQSISSPFSKEKHTIKLFGGYVPFVLNLSICKSYAWRRIGIAYTEDKKERFGDGIAKFSKGEAIEGSDFAIIKTIKEVLLHTEASVLQEIEDEYALDHQDAYESGFQLTHLPIMDRLISEDLIQKVNGRLEPTNEGLELYSMVKKCNLSSTSSLKQVNAFLKDFEKGNLDATQLQEKLDLYLNQMMTDLKNVKLPTKGGTYYCPKCKDFSIQVRKTAAVCISEPCDWNLVRDAFGLRLSRNEAIDLVRLSRSCKLRKVALGDKKIKASFILDDKFNLELLPRKAK